MKNFLIISVLFVANGLYGASCSQPAQERRHILINLKPENVSVQTAVYDPRGNWEWRCVNDILIQDTTLERRGAMLKSVCAYNEGISPVQTSGSIENIEGMWQAFMKGLPDEELEDEAFDRLSKPRIAIRRIATRGDSSGELLVGCTKFIVGESGKCVLMIPSTNQVSEQSLKEYVARSNVKEIIARAQQDPSKYNRLANMLASWRFYEKEQAMPVESYCHGMLQYDESAPLPVQEPKSLTAVMWIEP